MNVMRLGGWHGGNNGTEGRGACVPTYRQRPDESLMEWSGRCDVLDNIAYGSWTK